MRKLGRRQFIKAVGLSVAACRMSSMDSARGAGAAAAKPNIVVILVDDLGYGDLGCYGAKDLKTPAMDRLVASGMRIDPFYANCPVCSPTRASIMTGRFPDMVGVPGVIRTHADNNFGRLAPDAVLLPTLLKPAGYHTGIVGKWHLGLKSPDTPTERGFDFFHGFLGDMMDDYYTHRRHDINYMRLGTETIDPPGHATDLFTSWAAAYIKERAATGKPFFLYLAYNAPHTPIQPPPEWLARVKAREPDINDTRAKIVALIEHLDDGIGNVLAALTDAGVADNTLVIFTSDNGGQLNAGANNDSLHGGKQDMWEGGLREPMCAVWPGHVAPGSRSDIVAMTMDIFPTVCEAAGVAVKHTIDGRSFLPTLLGRKQPWGERDIFWPRLEGGRRYQKKPYYAVRRGRWKLLQNTADEPYRLFDLATDPGEERPLDESHPRYEPLRAALEAHIRAARAAAPWPYE